MKFSTAKKLVSIDFENFDLIKLQKHYVKLIDASREAAAEYGKNEAIKNGFLIPLQSESASGYIPRDKFLQSNINNTIIQVQKKLEEFYKAV